jgi:hypothetical protein
VQVLRRRKESLQDEAADAAAHLVHVHTTLPQGGDDGGKRGLFGQQKPDQEKQQARAPPSYLNNCLKREKVHLLLCFHVALRAPVATNPLHHAVVRLPCASKVTPTIGRVA